MSKFSEIKKDYPNAFLGNGMSHSEIIRRIKDETGTSKALYTYIIVANDTIYALGKGTDARAKPFTPLETDLGANGHIKGGIGALINIQYTDVERIFIPADSSQEALENESELKQKYSFHEIPVKTVSQKLIKSRLEMLQRSLPSSIFNQYFGDNKVFIKVLLRILGDPSGNDYATMKKVVYDIDRDYPGTVKAFNLFFKGGFKPLEVPSNKNQTSLFEIIKKIILGK